MPNALKPANVLKQAHVSTQAHAQTQTQANVPGQPGCLNRPPEPAVRQLTRTGGDNLAAQLTQTTSVPNEPAIKAADTDKSAAEERSAVRKSSLSRPGGASIKAGQPKARAVASTGASPVPKTPTDTGGPVAAPPSAPVSGSARRIPASAEPASGSAEAAASLPITSQQQKESIFAVDGAVNVSARTDDGSATKPEEDLTAGVVGRDEANDQTSENTSPMTSNTASPPDTASGLAVATQFASAAEFDPTAPPPSTGLVLPASDAATTLDVASSEDAIDVTPRSPVEPRDARPKGTEALLSPLFTDAGARPASPSEIAVPQIQNPVPQPVIIRGEQVAMHVAQALGDGGKTVTVELHPAELGRMEIRFSFHSDGMVVRMTLDRPETFDAFSRDRGGLEQQLTQAGINLGSGGLDLRLGQQSAQYESYSGGRNTRLTTPAPTTADASAMQWVGNGLIDILA
jgi:flagellar hook-length control protein FliK